MKLKINIHTIVALHRDKFSKEDMTKLLKLYKKLNKKEGV